ncbi:MAG: metallopeptidase family protein [Propionibacteriales bacterium]|nr:metallopeptidase family protein [Propionibacteriales bacterium]
MTDDSFSSDPAAALPVAITAAGPTERRTGPRRRDRHDRGMRGPAFGTSPLAPTGVPARRNAAEHFDTVALRVMHAVVSRWLAELGDVELAVEEVPVITETWQAGTVPLAAYLDRTATTAPRLVLFRRPLEHRAETSFDLEALLLTVVVEQFAEVLGIPAEDVHPGYEVE